MSITTKITDYLSNMIKNTITKTVSKNGANENLLDINITNGFSKQLESYNSNSLNSILNHLNIKGTSVTNSQKNLLKEYRKMYDAVKKEIKKIKDNYKKYNNEAPKLKKQIIDFENKNINTYEKIITNLNKSINKYQYYKKLENYVEEKIKIFNDIKNEKTIDSQKLKPELEKINKNNIHADIKDFFKNTPIPKKVIEKLFNESCFKNLFLKIKDFIINQDGEKPSNIISKLEEIKKTINKKLEKYNHNIQNFENSCDDIKYYSDSIQKLKKYQKYLEICKKSCEKIIDEIEKFNKGQKIETVKDNDIQTKLNQNNYTLKEVLALSPALVKRIQKKFLEEYKFCTERINNMKGKWEVVKNG